jgi:hypothetical protein
MPDFIPGIFNYCDRWCERCAFTKRCRLFAQEQKFEAKFKEWDEFFDALEKAGCEVRAPEQKADVSTRPPSKALGRRRRKDRLLDAADAYMDLAHAWLRTQPEPERGPDRNAEPGTLDDLTDVIGWYHLQIAVKLRRATSGLRSAEKVQPWEEDILAEADRSDADGSAKVALIGIERSLGAWTTLRTTFGRDEDVVRKAIMQLARLRRAAEERFPNARTFHRPGLDD